MESTNKTCIFTKYANNKSIDESFFELKSVPEPEAPTEGNVQVELEYISVDPYMRGTMNEGESYVGGLKPGNPYNGFVTGKIIKSASSNFQVGQTVAFPGTWTIRQNVSEKAQLNPIPEGIKSSYFLGALGMPGNSGLLAMKNLWLTSEEIKSKKHTIFVSGGAGAVGSTVGQICKSYGYTVIGSAGSQEKIDFLKEIGFDHVINYKTEDTEKKLKEYAPDGINMYYDNVGGETLDQAIAAMAFRGVIICCGSISGYDVPAEQRYGNKNLHLVIGKSLRMEGFTFMNYVSQVKESTMELVGLLKQGKLKIRETELNGFDKIPEGFLGLLKGKNIGKMIIKV